jgi:hypothetical protein
MRLISWNIQNPGAPRLDRQIAALATRTPDIVALQEVTARSAPLLQARLAAIGLLYATDSFGLTGDTSAFTGPRQYGALIAPLACSFIPVGTDELRDLFFQDGDERGTNGLPYLFLDKGAKGVLRRLTVRCRLGILGTGSHGDPPAWVSEQPQV